MGRFCELTWGQGGCGSRASHSTPPRCCSDSLRAGYGRVNQSPCPGTNPSRTRVSSTPLRAGPRHAWTAGPSTAPHDSLRESRGCAREDRFGRRRGGAQSHPTSQGSLGKGGATGAVRIPGSAGGASREHGVPVRLPFGASLLRVAQGRLSTSHSDSLRFANRNAALGMTSWWGWRRHG